jgi:tetratricopeptide (TPR) repeat protein
MKKQEKNQLPLSDDSTYIIILFVIFSLIFAISPYFRGLFFVENYYWVSLFIQVIFLVTTLLFLKQLRNWIISNWKIFILLFGIGLMYTLSYFGSSSPYLATNELLKWISYIAIFIMLCIWIQINKRISDGLWLLCWLTMLWIVGFVFLVDLGRLEFQDAVMGLRFASVFQYPNTLASIVSAFIVVGLMGLTKRVQIHYQLIYGMSLIPFMICFLLADSRGGFLVLSVGVVKGIIFLSWKEQVLYVLYTGLAVTLSFWGFITYNDLSIEKLYFNTALVIIGLSVIFTIIVFSIQFLINRKYNLFSKSKLNLILPIGLYTSMITIFTLGVKLSERFLSLSLFPEALQTRIRSINLEQHSVQERFLFYKDSLTVWQDHFWFGAGGGGWRALFESYKTLPYFSTQAHSFYMQTLVEVGLIGSIFVFGFFLYVLLKGISTYFKLDEQTRSNHNLLAPALVAVIILMLHNAIDFNMSFGTYNLFLFALLAIIWSYVHKHKGSNQPLTDTVFSKISVKLQGITNKQRAVILNTLITIIIVTSIFSTYKAFTYSKAESLYKEVHQGGDYNQAMVKINQAISFNYNDPKLRELRIQLLSFGYQELGTYDYVEAMDEEYQSLLKLAPTNFLYYMNYSEFLWENDRYDQALTSMDQALALAPWQQMVYEKNINYRLDYSLERAQTNNEVELQNQIVEIGSILNQLEEKLTIQEQELPKGLRLTNPIRLTNDNRLIFGKAYYYIGDFEKSLEYLAAIDMKNLEDSTKQNVLLIKLLNYQALNQQDNLIELLNSEIVKVLAVDQMYQQLKDNQRWLPLTKNSE